mmetsp:Transcript_31154/g.82584  ORF Transcript_31154/g.82584 Transcript_31154/m.82584 type:complete len:215 (+) Transcript_31154:441-1085(+)
MSGATCLRRTTACTRSRAASTPAFCSPSSSARWPSCSPPSSKWSRGRRAATPTAAPFAVWPCFRPATLSRSTSSPSSLSSSTSHRAMCFQSLTASPFTAPRRSFSTQTSCSCPSSSAGNGARTCTPRPAARSGRRSAPPRPLPTRAISMSRQRRPPRHPPRRARRTHRARPPRGQRRQHRRCPSPTVCRASRWRGRREGGALTHVRFYSRQRSR